MIAYKDSLFGFHLIFRVHGSAVWKASLPALLSTFILLVYELLSEFGIENNYLNRITEHVYTITAYVSFFSFLLTFRLNFAYQRVSTLPSTVQYLILWCSLLMDTSNFLFLSYMVFVSKVVLGRCHCCTSHAFEMARYSNIIGCLPLSV